MLRPALQIAPRWDWHSLTDEEKRSNRGKPYQQIMAEHPGLSERAAQYWVSRAGEMKTNGNGHV